MRLPLLAVLFIALFAGPAFALAPTPATQGDLPLKMLIRTAWPIKANESTDLVMHIWTDAGPITADQLQMVQGRKMHLFLLSPDFKEFYHLNPIATPEPGEYRVNFIPRARTGLRAWITFSTVEGSKRIMGDVNGEKLTPVPPAGGQQVVQVINGNLKFLIDFPDELLINREQLGSVITVNKDTNAPYRKLQPYLGSYAHIVTFGSDYKTMTHMVALGKPPENDEPTGGPAVYYKLTPTTPGPLAVFAEFRVDNRDIVTPFVVSILTHSKKVRSQDLENKSRPEHRDQPE